MTVFVVHPVRDDISKALRFGSFAFITGGYVYGDLLELDPGESWSTIQDWRLPASFRDSLRHAAIHAFNPAADYLLIAGDHLQLLAFTAYLSCNYESFMVLRYDRKLDDYIPVRLYSDLAKTTPPVLSSTPDIGAPYDETFAEDSKIIADDSLYAAFGHVRRQPSG